VFLDISDRLAFGGEQGLLGLAFHSNFNQNHYFYVNYVAPNPLRTVIARYTVYASNPNLADPKSMQIIMEYNQPFPNHNGGQLAFGPDGYLYIGTGDGGGAGDPFGNGQNLSAVLGKILRINVDVASAGRNYSVPSDNPYVGSTLGYREEIYAYGFRNPWRFSFDSATGQLWVGDVGQNRLEEIDLVEKGKNYGWNIMEGGLSFPSGSINDPTGMELPVWNYTRNLGYSVIGGYVYHGSALPTLGGAYVYGDYGSGRIWALRYNGTAASNELLVNTGLNIASFGVDTQNELYYTAYDGKIYQLNSTVVPEFPVTEGVLLVMATMVLLALMLKIAGKKQSSA
jgi:glucose/arabinose dehydrogenase